ncbi:MAG: YtxH domain-containing protein [Candidatus Dormiibacterota bacterium]
MTSDERTPQERIRAFTDAVDEEILRPTRRYVRGVRRGLMLGVALGILFAPRPGSETREKVLRAWRMISQHLPKKQPS